MSRKQFTPEQIIVRRFKGRWTSSASWRITTFKEEFPKAWIQGCQARVARNVLAKVPHKLKGAVADDLRSIFYASSKSKALEFSQRLKDQWCREYTTVRPHSALGYRPPAPEAIAVTPRDPGVRYAAPGSLG
jgi:hypothetical protein